MSLRDCWKGTMKILPATLLTLSAFMLVVVARRRRVSFVNCPSTKSNSSLVTVKPARSRVECSVICLNDPGCLSASYCKSGDGYTCNLSQVYLGGGCTGLTADGDCTQTGVVNPCENGGTFVPQNRTCRCADGFVGDYCHRRYRDCTEAPPAITAHTIQPFGSNYTFQWHCEYYWSVQNTPISDFRDSFSYKTTVSWREMKQGKDTLFANKFFFTGLENLHQLTKQGVYDMFVILVVMGKEYGHVVYKNFRVDSETEGYAWHWDSFIKYKNDVYLDGFGALGDSTKSLNGARFGTIDQDVNGCANASKFAWWYNPLGCSLVTFDPGLYWPTNRNGTVEIEKTDFAKIGLNIVHWYVEDDLVF